MVANRRFSQGVVQRQPSMMELTGIPVKPLEIERCGWKTRKKIDPAGTTPVRMVRGATRQLRRHRPKEMSREIGKKLTIMVVVDPVPNSFPPLMSGPPRGLVSVARNDPVRKPVGFVTGSNRSAAMA